MNNDKTNRPDTCSGDDCQCGDRWARRDFLAVSGITPAGALLGGLALAVSLGARTYVGNLIAGHQLQQHYEVGQTIHIGDYEGTIVEIATTLVILETPQGRLTLPCGQVAWRFSQLMVKASIPYPVACCQVRFSTTGPSNSTV